MMDIDVQALIDEFNRENPPEPVEDNEPVAQEDSEPSENNSEETDITNNEQSESAEEQPKVDENTEEISSSEELEIEEDHPMKDLSNQVKAKQTPEQNRAFAEMRRKLQEAEKAKKFLEKVAQESGVTVEQLVQSYEQKKMEMEAQKQGVPVDVYKRLQSLERANFELKKESQLNKFFGQVEITKQKYGLKDDEINRTFNFIGSKGWYDPDTKVPLVDFEDAYFLANRDNLIQRKIEEARQQMLAEKKKRQQQAAVPHTSSNADSTPQVEEWTDEAIDKQLERMGLDHMI